MACRTAPASRVTVTVLTVLTGAGLLGATGCALNYETIKSDRTEQVAVTRVQVGGSSGDVTVRPGQPGQVQVHWAVHRWGGGDQPGTTYRIEGTTLRLGSDCGHRCSVDYDVRVPEGVTVTGESGSGDISLTGVSTVDVTARSGDVSVTRATGPVGVQARAGDVRLRDIGGDITVRASAGDIQALDVHAASTTLRASAGDVRVELARPGNLRTEAASGDVKVAVPPGTGYRVSVAASSGDQVVDVPRDPAGAYHLDVQANSGDVSMTTRQ